MTVELNIRWLLVLVSVLIMMALKDHRAWLIGYSIFALVSTVGWGVFWPRYCRRIYEKLKMMSLRATDVHSAASWALILEKHAWMTRCAYAYGYHELMGLLAYRQERYVDATDAFLTALKTAPLDAQVRIRLNLGQAYLALRDFDGAQRTYEDALRIDPYSMLAANGLRTTEDERLAFKSRGVNPADD